MICSNCGNPVDGSRKFCQVCGYPVKQPAEDRADTGLFAGTPASYNNVADLSAEQGDDYSINKPSYPQPATPTECNNDVGYEEKPKKKMFKKILIPVVALVLAAVIALSGWGIFLAVNPEVKIARAIEKTLFNTKSFSFEATLGDTEVASGYVAFGKTTFTSDFAVELYNGLNVVCDDGQLLFPVGREGYYAVDMPGVFSELTEGLDDIITQFVGGNSEELVAMLENRFGVTTTPEQVAEWAETLIKNKTINEDVIEDIWNTVGIPVAAKEFDLDEKDIPNYKDAKSIISGAFTKGIKGDAFKVKDTSSSGGVKYYECEIVPAELMKGMIKYALDCKKLEAILEIEIDGYTLKDQLETYLEVLEDEEYPEYLDEEIEFTVGLKGGYIAAVEYENLEIEISDINKKYDAKDDYDDAAEKVYRKEDLGLDDLMTMIFGSRRKAPSVEANTYYY